MTVQHLSQNGFNRACKALSIFLLLGFISARICIAQTTDTLPQNSPEPPSNVQWLAPGKGIEREMKGGETHSYLVKLRHGDFMHVEVDQRGIDVVVSLLAPDGQKLVE